MSYSPTVILDFETRSEIDLAAEGAYKYCMHPSTQILCCAYQIDTGEVQIWKPWEGRMEDFRRGDARYDLNVWTCPEDLRVSLEIGTIIAHNASFDRIILTHILHRHCGWPLPRLSQWRCTATQASHCGLPRSLAAASRRVGDEIKSESSSMATLCRPVSKPCDLFGHKWPGSAELYDRLCEYCAQDVRATASIWTSLPKLSNRTWEMYEIDQRINDRGIAVDDALVHECILQRDDRDLDANREIAQITSGKVTSVSQIAKLRSWIKTNSPKNIAVPDLSAETVRDLLLRSDISPAVRRVAQIRQSAGGAAEFKYDSLAQRSWSGRIYGELIMDGARTGRWTSMGVQLQNTPRPIMNGAKIMEYAESRGAIPTEDLDAFLTSAPRACLIAAPGNVLIELDYSAIEARIVAWMADCEALLSGYHNGVDLYRQFAALIYGCAPDDVSKSQRTFGKICILSLGYKGHTGALDRAARKYGLCLSDETLSAAVHTYRSRYPEIVALWNNLYATTMRAIQTKKTITFDRWEWDWCGDAMTIRLPSQRLIYYPEARIENDQPVYRTAKGFTNPISVQVLTENIDSGMACELLKLALRRLGPDAPVVLLVHDSIVLEVPEGEVDAWITKATNAMTTVPTWATGLPLAVEASVGKRLIKE